MALNIPTPTSSSAGHLAHHAQIVAEVNRLGGSVDASPSFVSVKSKGAVGDGVTDDTAAIRAAIVEAGRDRKLRWPPGTYLVTDSLVDADLVAAGLPTGWQWVGDRDERGAGGALDLAGYQTATIKFRPSDTSKPLVRAWSADSPGSLLGPFIHENLAFDLGDANGLVFGVEDSDHPATLDPVDPPGLQVGAGQRYVFSVKFHGCALQATPAARPQSVASPIARSGRKLLRLAKAFEFEMSDTSLFGGDVQVRGYGCDRPVVDGVRSQGAHLPFDWAASIGEGGFGVHHVMQDVQVEGWTFAAVRSSTSIALTAPRLENAYSLPGVGRALLPVTAAVVADSATITMSADVTGVLWPRLSLIEVTDGERVVRAVVESVSGASVTVDPGCTVFTWSAPAAAVYRIHGFGLLHVQQGSANDDMTVTSGSITTEPGTPTCVLYPKGGGRIRLVGVESGFSGGGERGAVVAANRLPDLALDSGIEAVASSPMSTPPANHPFARVDNQRAGYGSGQTFGSQRVTGEPLFDSVAAVRRLWAFTPGAPGHTAAAGSSTSCPVEPYPDGVQQTIWAWHVRSGGYLVLSDRTVPSDPAHRVRVRIRLRSAAGTTTPLVDFHGSSITPLVSGRPLGAAWEVWDYEVPMPAAWSGDSPRTAGGLGDPGVFVYGDGVLVAGILVEEILGNERAAFPGGVGTLAKAGPVADEDFPGSPASGLIGVDVANSRLYARVGSDWRYAELGTGGQGISVTPADGSVSLDLDGSAWVVAPDGSPYYDPDGTVSGTRGVLQIDAVDGGYVVVAP